MDLEVPESHANYLCTACGFAEGTELPHKLVTKYWEMKRLSDRLSDAMTVADLKHVAYELGYGKILDREANPTIVDLYRAGKVRRESPVVVDWRNGKKSGVLKKVDGFGRVIVQMEGDTEERQIAVDKVQLAELVTA